MPLTISPMRTTPSLGQPDSPMSRQDMTPSSTTPLTSATGRLPPAETI